MATVVSPPSQDRGSPAAGSQAPAGEPSPGAGPPPAAAPDGHPCATCGAPMAPGQDWCLQCGAGAPGSVGSRDWRPWAIALGATAVLLLGAAAAAYAALKKEPKHAAVTTATVAQATPPPATTPVPTPAPVPAAPAVKVPPIATTPSIPTKAVAPPVTTPVTPAAPSGGTNGGETKASGQPAEKPQPKPILLDTDAASTYNPYAYPESSFGDPSLTIDGDTSTGWSAQVNPATAPAMAEGVVIDLKSAKKLSAVKLVTTTPGITLQLYGSDAKTLPASITDESWIPISRSLTLEKRRARITLKDQTKPLRFVTVWISGAPASAAGTPESPGRVTLNEIELFRAS